MKTDNNSEFRKIRMKDRPGDEAPSWKHFLVVILVTGLLIGLSWVMWFKWGWFH